MTEILQADVVQSALRGLCAALPQVRQRAKNFIRRRDSPTADKAPAPAYQYITPSPLQ